MTKMTEMGTILDEIVGKIANAFNPEKIIIFGSYAYGRPTEKSDIDILVKTPAEVKHRLDIGDPFIGEIISKGKVLAHGKTIHKITKQPLP